MMIEIEVTNDREQDGMLPFKNHIRRPQKRQWKRKLNSTFKAEINENRDKNFFFNKQEGRSFKFQNKIT